MELDPRMNFKGIGVLNSFYYRSCESFVKFHSRVSCKHFSLRKSIKEFFSFFTYVVGSSWPYRYRSKCIPHVVAGSDLYPPLDISLPSRVSSVWGLER